MKILLKRRVLKIIEDKKHEYESLYDAVGERIDEMIEANRPHERAAIEYLMNERRPEIAAKLEVLHEVYHAINDL